MINLREFIKCGEEEFQGMVRDADDVAISVDGKYRYIWRSETYDDYIHDESDHETDMYSCDTSFDDNSFAEVLFVVTVVPVEVTVEVTVYNEEKICQRHDFKCPSVFLVPVREVQGNAVTSIACNSQFQFVACSREHTSYDDNDNDRTNVIIVTVAVWNKRQHLWKRSIITERGAYNANASALITRDGDLVVTWQTLDEGAGIHILNATTGTTLHSLLTDQHIIDCAFLSDGKHFVCCSSEDQIVRLFNVNSGVLISLIDIETHPYCLAAYLTNLYLPLAVRTMRSNFRVHVPEVKDSERKTKESSYSRTEKATWVPFDLCPPVHISGDIKFGHGTSQQTRGCVTRLNTQKILVVVSQTTLKETLRAGWSVSCDAKPDTAESDIVRMFIKWCNVVIVA
ncbi:hypothetical protein OS493_037485 [Desmophyllum pertusum]|uniref:Uncharacterized protein n=1 Tax=Desmophyllum pertusum TaxID=174260 RepID=A0A9X0CVP3_9CNID|nr:hypothetical protein OS493_037485 [Desmophyllum pertusum]